MRPNAPRLLFLVVFAALLLLPACSYRHEKSAAPAQPPSGGATAGRVSQTSFAEVRDQVLAPKCVSCHRGYSDYSRVFADREAIRRTVFAERRMPKNDTLSGDQARTLQMWLDAGAPETGAAASAPSGQPQPSTPSPAPVIEPLAPTWANVRARFFEPHCARCHGEEAPEGDVNLTDLASVRTNAGGILNRVLVEQNMPPSPRAYSRITEEEKLLLTRWVSAKMPGP